MLNSISNLSNSIIEKFGIMDKTVRDLTSGEPMVDSISFDFPFIVKRGSNATLDSSIYVLNSRVCVALNVLNRAHWIEYSFQNRQIKYDKRDNFYVSKSIPLTKPNALSLVHDLPGILQNDMIPAIIAKSIYAHPYKRFCGVLRHNRIAHNFVDAFVQQTVFLNNHKDLWDEDDAKLADEACDMIHDFSNMMVKTINRIDQDSENNIWPTAK